MSHPRPLATTRHRGRQVSLRYAQGPSVVSGSGRVLLFVAMLFAACTSASEENSPKKRVALQLKVMEFNIEYGGHEIDFDSVVEAIQKSDADVVAIEEAWGNMPLLARRLGWRYFDRRMQLVSQLPLLAPAGATASIPSSTLSLVESSQ